LLRNKQINSSNGFTFIELLLTLFVLSTLLLLAVPIHNQLLKKINERSFLETLHYDVLLLQNTSLVSRNILQLQFFDDHYRVNLGNQYDKYERTYPTHLNIDKNAVNRISFNYKGTIRQPSTFRLIFDNQTYRYICPLGKGRCYFE